MKLHLAVATLPALVTVTGYSMGGYNMFGRPVIITPGGVNRGPCSPNFRQQQPWVDRAFQDLENEVRRGRPSREVKINEEVLRQQQEWINRAFGLANEVASGMAGSPREEKDSKEAVRQQQEWVNRAFGLAKDVASGMSSPRYEISDDDETFQVALDVPGVKASDIDISVEEDGKVLTIRGQRVIGMGDKSRTAKFSKSFSIDPAVIDAEKFTAQLSNGVLLVSVPKDSSKVKEDVKKIPVEEVNEEVTSVEDTVEESNDSTDATKEVDQDSSSTENDDDEDSNSVAA